MSLKKHHHTVLDFIEGVGSLNEYLRLFLPQGNSPGEFFTTLRECLGPVPNEDLKVLREENLKELREWIRSAGNSLRDLKRVEPEKNSPEVQFRHRLLALLYGGLAASVIPVNPEDEPSREFIEWTNLCGEYFDAAWFYHINEKRIGDNDGSNKDGVSGEATRALMNAQEHLGRWSVHHHTWLMVRRLLAYLHGDEGHKPSNPLAADEPIMLVTVGSGGGALKTLKITAHAEYCPGWYFDPVLMGTTIFDDDMQSSVELAGRLAFEKLIRSGSPPWAIRLSTPLEPGNMIDCLKGDSAGGLIASSLYELPNGRKVTRNVTATVSLNTEYREKLKNCDPISERDILLSPVGGVSAKLSAVLMNQEHIPIRQVAIHPDNEAEAELWRNNFGIVPDTRQSFDTFTELYRFLTTGSRIEAVLRDYCHSIQQEWNRAVNNENDPDALKHYVPPSYLKKVRDGEIVDQQELNLRQRFESGEQKPVAAFEPVGDWNANEDEQLEALFTLSNRLIVTEDAGAGKSIFTRRCMSWFASPATWDRLNEGQPYLPYRWEGANAKEWPKTSEGFRAHLEAAIAAFCGPRDIEPHEVIDYACEHGRLVLFCDSLDQNHDDDQKKALAQFVEMDLDPSDNRNRLVITSRAYAYEDSKRTLFRSAAWKLCKISGFSHWQQLIYLRDLLEKFTSVEAETPDWSRWFDHDASQTIEERNQFAEQVLAHPDVFGDTYKDVVELLAVPAILAFVRVLSRQGEFPRFSNRADLYFQAIDELLERNLEKKTGLAGDIRKNKLELREVLSAVAFQMMLDNARNYVVHGELALAKLEKKARSRISNLRVLEKWDDTFLSDGTTRPGLWSFVEHLAGFSSHLVVECKSSGFFGWKHRGMMEFYCGLFLASNSHPEWDITAQGSSRAGEAVQLSERLAEGDWEWPMRFALSLRLASNVDAREFPSPETLTPTLHALFQPKQSLPRPTKLMFEAWQVMEIRAYPHREEIRAEYRRQFNEILTDGTLDEARRAAELITEEDLQQRLTENAPAKWNFEELRPAHIAYVTCSDATKPDQFRAEVDEETKRREYTDPNHLTFLMGASPDDERASEFEKYDSSNPEEWWHEVRLKSFDMATACVTRDQYKLFDIARLRQTTKYIASSEDCPIVEINGYDASCFAFWLGDRYTLPSECEWEAAAWGGIERRKHQDYRIGVPPYSKNFSRAEVNFSGNVSWTDRDESYWVTSLTPVRCENYEPNGFGLWQMQGNVEEWCRSPWLDELRSTIESENTRTPPFGSAGWGGLRGGSWCNLANCCRVSYRNGRLALNRDTDMGFRVLKFR